MQEHTLSSWNLPLPRAAPAASPVRSLVNLCRHCCFAELCQGTSQGCFGGHRPKVRRVARGEFLYLREDGLTALYVVRSGFFKTQQASENGQQHVFGFQMSGDVLGLDGIGPGFHTSEAVALEDSMVCVLPCTALQRLSDGVPGLSQRLCHVLAQEIAREQRARLRLGCMGAQDRLVDFLLELSERLGSRGFSASRLRLRMGRSDIGEHLGLSFETVSRSFSRLQAAGMLEVNGREIRIVDLASMQARLAPACAKPKPASKDSGTW